MVASQNQSHLRAGILTTTKDNWKPDVPTVSDGEEIDEETLRRKLQLGEDSPWVLDDTLQSVIFKALPEEVRVPVALFQYLYPHQRLGVEWMAGRRMAKTGGRTCHDQISSVVLRSLKRQRSRRRSHI